MAFPVTALPIVVGLAAGADPVDPSTWNFTDISSDTREAGDVTIQVGAQNEASQVDATQVRLTLDNSGGDYCRTNPLGAYYGSLDKGSPIQVRVTRINDSFTRTTSPGWGTDTVSGLAWSHGTPSYWAATGSAGTCAFAAANTAALALLADATGHDVDITHTSSLAAVATGASWVDATVVRYSDSSNYYTLYTEFGTGGTISVKIVKLVAGVSTTIYALTSTGVSYSAGTRICTRVRAVGPTLQIRCWLESGSEPTTWHAQVDDTDLTGTIPGLYEWRVSGNTNVGTLTATIDNYRVDVIRATVPVPEWPTRWDKSGNNVVAPISGAGILRRLAQGQPATQSPIYRQLVAQDACAYWPMEDGSDATTASNAVTNGKAASGLGVTFGSSDCPPGASSAATLSTAGSSYIQGRGIRWTVAQDGYAQMAYFRLPTLSASGSPVAGNRIMTALTVGTVVRWTIYATSTGFYIEGYDNVGAKTVDTGSFAYGIDPSQWFALQLETSESGGTVNWALIWHQVGSTSFSSGSGSYAGTADRIHAAAACAPVDGTMVSHFWIGDDSLPFVDSTFQLVSDGYAGETAGDRLTRLFEEAGIPFAITGDPDDTAAMGAQRPGTLLTAARECEAADQGILIESGAGLGFVTHASRRNQTATMDLDFDDSHIAEPPEPVDDDQRLRNRVSLDRTGGGRAIVEDSASIASSGVYDETATVNLETDAQLVQHAGWRLHLGTVDELRWPKIRLNLARNPSLIPDWCSVRIGSRITIANPPDAVATGDDLDLIVEGWTETLGTYRWDVELVCSPARPWDVAVYGTARYDSATTTLQSTAAAGATSLTLTYPIASEGWSTTAEPYDLLIAGEVVTCTSMGSPSGSGPYTQVATVTRAVNGISKSLTAGSEVHIATPGRYAL